MHSPTLDFAKLFDASPNPYLVLDRQLHIAAANRAYLEATGQTLDRIVGRWAWDAFPTDPETERQAVASFKRVIETKQPDTMALLRFDLPRAEADGGGFEKRYWSLFHSPVLDDAGEVAFVVQHALDVTELEQLREGTGEPGGELKSAHAGIFERAESVHRANLLLTAESDRLRALFEEAPSFICVVSGPEHRFEFANKAYQRLVGGRAIAGRPVREALPELHGQGFFELLDGVYRSGERFVAEAAPVQLRNDPAGSVEERFLDFIYEPVCDPNGTVTGIFVEGHDVTERVRAEAKMRESEERNRRIVEGVRGYSIYTTDREGTVVDWTPGAEAVFGWPAEEIVGQNSAILFTPEDRAAGRPAEELVTAQQQDCAPDERWHVRRDGSRFFANGSVRPLHNAEGGISGFLKIARDETERRATEAALRESDARLRALTDNLPSGMVYQLLTSRDGRKRRFLYVSQSHERLTGVPASAVLADPFATYNLVLPEDRDWMLQAEAEAIRTLRPFDVQVRFRRADGGLRWCRIISAPREHDEGHLIWDGIQIDVTEQKQAEEALQGLNETLERRVAERAAELARAEDQLRQSQKMEAIGQLTGGVAHDFNNLLTIIRSSADLLRRPELPENKRRRYMDAIADTADRAAKLTSQLLAFARRQALKPEVFSVDQRVRGIADMLRTILGGRIELHIRSNCHDCRVEADPGQFETALVNLAVNARDAMTGEGRLTLTVDTAPELPPVRGHAGGSGDFVTVEVADTGSGIGPEVVGRIFEPFFTTKEVGKGTGLGLSQVFGFTKQSGGEVAVASTPGEGTRFTLYLPRVYSKAAVAEDSAVPPAQQAHGRVLVVEDNSAVGEFAVQMLADLGYQPELVANAAEALRRLDAQRGLYDAMFSDVVMPGMNGIELARIVSRHWPDLPVILTSGYSHALAEDARHGFQLLRKPYSIDELSNMLERSLGKRPQRERELVGEDGGRGKD